jgi:hypothetical protein
MEVGVRKHGRKWKAVEVRDMIVWGRERALFVARFAGFAHSFSQQEAKTLECFHAPA